MNERKEETRNAGPAEAAASKKAEKVRSSRYEWERKSGEPDRPPAKPAQGSLMAALAAWLKKLAALNFFDKDDDATPSAA
jgi:hypothetical protein